nr:MAG TPA: hypothetical protein [Caudoviricetes sp.]
MIRHGQKVFNIIKHSFQNYIILFSILLPR